MIGLRDLQCLAKDERLTQCKHMRSIREAFALLGQVIASLNGGAWSQTVTFKS